MGHDTEVSGRRGAAGGSARLLAAACSAVLLGWLLVPGGAGGQVYELPPAPPAPPPATAAPLPLLTPFPIVRIVSRTTARGARIILMTVRAAGGTYIVSRCVGRATRCPYGQRFSRIPGPAGRIRTVHVRAFERSFRAGVVLRVYVVNAGRTGKFTSFKIRDGRAPRRNDGCVADVVLKLVTCPTN